MNIRQYLFKHDMSHRDFARKAMISPATLKRILAGKPVKPEIAHTVIYVCGGELEEGDVVVAKPRVKNRGSFNKIG